MSAPAARRPGPSSAAFAPIPTPPRRAGTSSCAACPRCGCRRPSPTRANSGRCPSAPSCPSPTRSRIRRCGWPSPAPAPRSTPPTAGWAASASPSRASRSRRRRSSEYRRRIKSCEPVGAFVNEQVATTNFLFCHEDEKTGVEMGKRLGNTFNYLATQLISTREVFSSPSYQSLGLLPALRRAATGPDANEQQTEGMAYGDPARIIRAVKKWESLGVDCINFILNANEVVPQDQVMASLRLFAKEVMPVFAKEPAAQSGGGVSHAPLRNARHHPERQGAADAGQPRHRGLDPAQGRDAAAPDRGAAQHDRRAAAQGDASGAALLRDPGGHEILREPGRAVQSRGAAPGQPRRRPSARLPAGRRRQHRGGGQGTARPLGLAGRGRRGEVPAPP